MSQEFFESITYWNMAAIVGTISFVISGFLAVIFIGQGIIETLVERVKERLERLDG